MKQITDIDWDNWQAKDPATLVFVIRDGKILLINNQFRMIETNFIICSTRII